MVKSLYLALGVAAASAVLLSFSNQPGLRVLRLVAILATYGSGLALLFADRFLRAAGVWCAVGVTAGLLYYAYDAWSAAKKAREMSDELAETASLSHLPMGILAWPVMLPEVSEYWLADLGLLRASAEGSEMHRDLFEALEELGFLDSTPSEATAEVKSVALSHGWPYAHEANGRYLLTDAESLAEGGVDEFLEQARPFLESRGATVPEAQDVVDDSYGAYSVVVGTTEHTIYTAAESRQAVEQLGLLWGLATARAFGLINGLLAEAGAQDRLYALSGGNDLAGVFLTDAMAAVIRSQPDLPFDSIPYTPDTEHPWFGQPH